MGNEAKEMFGHGVPDRLVWCDLETNGLDPERHMVLEVAVVVTDWQLVELAHFTQVVKPHADLMLTPFILDMHGRNGLLAELAGGRPIGEVDDRVRAFVGEYGGPLAGATPSFDRTFIRRHMPGFNACFDHRCFDVSTLKQCARMWGEGWPKDEGGHRALSDIRGTIAECRKLMRFWVPTLIAGVVQSIDCTPWLTPPPRHPDLGPPGPDYVDPYNPEVGVRAAEEYLPGNGPPAGHLEAVSALEQASLDTEETPF